MSQRPRSSINSHYFTTDPVSIREPGSRQSGSNFFTKGHENSPKRQDESGSLNSLLPSGSESSGSQPSGSQPSITSNSRALDREPLLNKSGPNNSFPSELSTFDSVRNISSMSSSSSSRSTDSSSSSLPSGTETDVFTVNGADGLLQVDRSLLRETLQQLKGDSQTPVNQLTPEKTESFKSVLEALRMLYSNQSAYDIILGDIRHEFSDVTIVKPGTVAAFFIGCFTNDKFTGPVGCSPNCVASVFPANGTTGYAHCDDLVLIYNDGIFSSLNEKRSTHAYIYVGDTHFTGFSIVNITQLKDAGVESASIVFGNTDGTFREVTSMLALDQLPKYSEVKTDAVNASTNSTNSTGGSNSSNTLTTTSAGGVIVIVLIVIAIIVLLYFIYRDNYR